MDAPSPPERTGSDMQRAFYRRALEILLEQRIPFPWGVHLRSATTLGLL
jgi:hypothetical protein